MVLLSDQLLPSGNIFGALFEIIDGVKTRTSAHELEDAIHAKHRSEFRLNGCRLETGPDLETRVMNYNGLFYIEEPGGLADLLQRSLTESLLDDDVEELIHHALGVERHILAGHGYLGHASFIDMDYHVGFLKVGAKFHRVPHYQV